MFCQAFRFLAGKMNDCPMFGRSKVSSPHHSLVKLSQRSEMYEVGSFTESEIMNLLPVHIIYPHQCVSTSSELRTPWVQDHTNGHYTRNHCLPYPKQPA